MRDPYLLTCSRICKEQRNEGPFNALVDSRPHHMALNREKCGCQCGVGLSHVHFLIGLYGRTWARGARSGKVVLRPFSIPV